MSHSVRRTQCPWFPGWPSTWLEPAYQSRLADRGWRGRHGSGLSPSGWSLAGLSQEVWEACGRYEQEGNNAAGWVRTRHDPRAWSWPLTSAAARTWALWTTLGRCNGRFRQADQHMCPCCCKARQHRARGWRYRCTWNRRIRADRCTWRPGRGLCSSHRWGRGLADSCRGWSHKNLQKIQGDTSRKSKPTRPRHLCMCLHSDKESWRTERQVGNKEQHG